MARIAVLALGLIGPALAAGALIWAYINLDVDVDLSADEGDAWVTYRNQAFHYEISYPPDWTIEVRDPRPGDDFLTQWVNLSRGEADVQVTVNFQGGWCESGYCDHSEIEVAGVHGTQDLWDWDLDGSVNWAVRHFPEARDQSNYTIIATPGGELELTLRVLDTFTFLD
jgi:hypothetical protein